MRLSTSFCLLLLTVATNIYAVEVTSFRCKQGVIKLGDSLEDVTQRCQKQMQGKNYLKGGSGKHDAKLKFTHSKLTKISLIRPKQGKFR